MTDGTNELSCQAEKKLKRSSCQPTNPPEKRFNSPLNRFSTSAICRQRIAESAGHAGRHLSDKKGTRMSRSPCHSGPELLLSGTASEVRQKTCDDPQKRQKRTDTENEPDTGTVGQPPEERRTDAAQTERKPEKDARNHPDLARHEVGGIDQNGRKSGRRTKQW